MNVAKTSYSGKELKVIAKILKTIAHPVKLQILQVLAQEEPIDVSTLCSRVGSDCQISMMSHHLTKMKDNGIVTSEKEGKQVYYKLVDRHILRIFDCIADCELSKNW